MGVRDLLVRVLGDSKSLERTFLKSTATGKVFGREMELVGRKVDRSLSGLSALSSGRGFAGGLVAAAALTGLKQLVGAASDSQQVLGQTRVALDDAGISWDRYGDRVEAAAASLSRLGFDDEEALKAISTFARATGDVSRSIDDTALAADIARARYIDLASATNIVLKASLGQAGALRRIGIDARNGASGIELLTLLQRKYGGAAKSAAGDAATANERLSVALQNVEEQIGSGLLPTISAFSGSLSEAADNASKLVKALQGLPGVGSAGGSIFGAITKAQGSGLLLPGAQGPELVRQLLKGWGIGDGAEEEAVGEVNKVFGNIASAIEKAFAQATKRLGDLKPPESAGISASQRNTFFDNALSRSLDRVQDADLKSQVAKLAAIEQTISARIKVTKDITRKLTLEDDLVSVRRQRKGVEQQIADALADRLRDAKAARIEEKAKALEDLRERQETALKKLQGRQFKALGLNADGGDIVPGVDNLKKQLASLTDRLAGSKNLSSKLKSQFEGVGKVLSGSLGRVTEESRQAIVDLFETIRGTFDKESGKTKGPLTKTTSLNANKILQGLGLSPEDERQLKARLSHFNSAGVALSGAGQSGRALTRSGSQRAIVVSVPDVYLDGRKVTSNVSGHQARNRRSNPSQRRGPNAGLLRG